MQSLFNFIIHPMEIGLVWLSLHVGGAGIAIILFTIFVRAALSPLNIMQLRNAKSMQRVQPLVAELRKKHGKDRQALSQATMALYKEHQVNPAMGCLPTLLQFPILIGLFYALMHLGEVPQGFPTAIQWGKILCNNVPVGSGKWSVWLSQCYAITGAGSSPQHIFSLFHANFLWLSHGLGQPDPLYILPVLAGVTQWIQSRMMLTRSVDPQQQMMNTMMNFMPLMIVFFALRYASGLSLYWVTSTTIGILIQYRITGLGLLPETLRGLAQGGPFRGAASRGGSGTKRAVVGARPVPKSSAARKLSAPEPGTDTPLNGKNHTEVNGTGEQTLEAAQQAPRKRANRAKGGRRGRRG